MSLEPIRAHVRLEDVNDTLAWHTLPDEPAIPLAPLAFEDFYVAHVDLVYRALAVSLSDVHLAMDAADEAMTRAFERWEAVRSTANPAGWVYRVGLNWATSRWRKRRRESLFGLIPDVSTPTPDQDGTALAALERLPVDQRAVLVCRALLGMSTRETASVLKVAEGTVKSRMARGLATLRSLLEEEERG